MAGANEFYSPSYAGEAVLKACNEMRFGLVSKAKINFAGSSKIVQRVEEISRINRLSMAELKIEYRNSFGG